MRESGYSVEGVCATFLIGKRLLLQQCPTVGITKEAGEPVLLCTCAEARHQLIDISHTCRTRMKGVLREKTVKISLKLIVYF
jgi:hypothetical protein